MLYEPLSVEPSHTPESFSPVCRYVLFFTVSECYLTYPQVQLLTDIDSIADVSIWLH